jgi:hypothetical protein
MSSTHRKIKTRPSRRHGLGFECLERRHMLAGNVAAQLLNGVLQLNGDSAANKIEFLESGADFVIRGQDGTLVDFVPTETRFAKSRTMRIEIRMGDGDDVVLLDKINANGNTFTGGVSVFGEKGRDFIALGAGGHNQFFGPVLVDLGADGGRATIDDTEALAGSNVDALRVIGDTGDFVIAVGRTKPIRSAGNVVISTGSGADTILVEQLMCSGSVLIDAGDGADTVTAGSLNPSTTTSVSAKGEFDVRLGEGPDSLVLDAVHIVGNITIDTGAGSAADQVTIGDGMNPEVANRTTQDGKGSSTKGNLLIRTGDGDDSVAVNYTTVAGRLSIDLGRSNGAAVLTTPNLIVRNSSVSGNVDLGGESSSAPMLAGRAVSNYIAIAAFYTGGSLAIRGGDGADVMDIKGSLIAAGTLSMDTGAGGDTIKLDHSIARSVVLLTGGAADVAEVTANMIDDFFLDLGLEADRCMLSGVSFRRYGFATGNGALGQGRMFTFDTPTDAFSYQGITPK